jgi:hypothetical protein
VCNKIEDYIVNFEQSHKKASPERGGGPLAVEVSETKQQKTNTRYKYDITNLDTIKYSDSLQEAIKINETADNRII